MICLFVFAASTALGAVRIAEWKRCSEWSCNPSTYRPRGNWATKSCVSGADWFSKRVGELREDVPGTNYAMHHALSLGQFCKERGYDGVGKVYLPGDEGELLNDNDAYCNAVFMSTSAWDSLTAINHHAFLDATFKCINWKEEKSSCCSIDDWYGKCYSGRQQWWNNVSCAWLARNSDNPADGTKCASACGDMDLDNINGSDAPKSGSGLCLDCCVGLAEVRQAWNCPEPSSPSAPPTPPPTPPPTDAPTDAPTNPPTAPSTLPPTDAPTARSTLPPTEAPPQACKAAKDKATCDSLDHCDTKSRKNKFKKCKKKKCRRLKSPALCKLALDRCEIIEKKGMFKKCEEKKRS